MTKPYWIVVRAISTDPIFSFRFKAKNVMDVKSFAIEYAQYLVVVLFGVCCIGACLSTFSIVFAASDSSNLISKLEKEV